MSGVPLPRVSAAVLTEAVDSLPGRLRKKIDETAARAAGWPVTIAGDGDEYTIVVDEATTVTLTAVSGVVRSAGAARCSCLLAPNCLHRASVLACAPVDDGTGQAGEESGGPDPAPGRDPAAVAGQAAGDPVAGGDAAPRAVRAEAGLTAAQRAVAESLWRAGAAVLEGGAGTSGVVVRTTLLRAAHEAQAAGAYRGAAAARRVAAELQAWPHGRLADLAESLRELLGVSWQLRRHPAGAVDAASLLGSARRRYDPRGSLRLYGLFSTAVLAASGHAGVVSYLADRDGTVWTVADIAPGDARRAASAGNATVRPGESGLTHRALGRAGLIVSGATASAARQLGAGSSVRATAAPGVAWSREPLAGLWRQPLAEQARRAFGALALPAPDRPAGSDLLFLALRGAGVAGGALRAVTDDGMALWLREASDDPALRYRDNLRVLGQLPGLEMLVIARPDRSRRATVYPLAVASRTAPGRDMPDPGWALPEPFTGHADLAFDRLHPSQFAHAARTADSTGDPTREAPAASLAGPPAADPMLHLLRTATERAVAGGRAVVAMPPTRVSLPDSQRLLRARLGTGSMVLDQLTIVAAARPRDAFGRLAADGDGAFARAWLAAAAYLDAASGVLSESSWLPREPG